MIGFIFSHQPSLNFIFLQFLFSESLIISKVKRCLDCWAFNTNELDYLSTPWSINLSKMMNTCDIELHRFMIAPSLSCRVGIKIEMSILSIAESLKLREIFLTFFSRAQLFRKGFLCYLVTKAFCVVFRIRRFVLHLNNCPNETISSNLIQI